MKKIIIRPNGTKRVFTINQEPSKTDQSFQKECDVNHIIARYKKTGQITHLANLQGQFADVSEIPDLLTATITVARAQQTFDELPAELRKKFGNSPINMVEWLKDSQNDDEAVRLGLKVKPLQSSLDLEEIEEQPKPKAAVAKKPKETNQTSD